MDYVQMTAPCGLPCFECYLYLANADEQVRAMVSEHLKLPLELSVCKGCRNEDGKCGHHPMACRVYPCAQNKGINFCYECTDFPCDNLHPYVDRAEIWHNTKVFNLCLIKKMGLESWAKNKAKKARDTYFYGKWTL
jgi:hypothetical protein